MSKEVRKQVDKIYKKIDLLAKKGKDNVFEYYKYIDELVAKEISLTKMLGIN